MNKIQFSNGTKTSSAKVTIEGTDYEVTPATYDGATPLNATVFNNMQENIEDAIDTKANTSDVYTKIETEELIPTKDHLLNVSSNIDNSYKVNMIKTKNLFDENDTSERFNGNIADTSATTITPATYTYIVYIPVKSNTTYAITKVKCASTNIFRVADTTTIPAQNVAISNVEDFSTETIGIHTTNSTAKYMAIAIIQTNITTTTLKEVLDSIQIEEGSTATTYEPFIQNEININNEKYSDTINVGAEEDSRSKVNILHSNNLINPQFATTTQNGVTITNNGNGTYTLNGTATDTVQFNLMTNLNLTGTYKMTGCPSTGSQETYYMFARNSAWSKFISDKGEGTIGTFDSTVAVLCITVANGVTCNNVVFKPMITKDTSKTYADFEPYIVPSIKVDNEEIYKQPKVLWENSSPTTDIANNGSFNLNSDDYTEYEIQYYMSTSDNANVFSTGRIPKGKSTILNVIRSTASGITGYERPMNYNSDTLIKCGIPYSVIASARSATASILIPYRIIGY